MISFGKLRIGTRLILLTIILGSFSLIFCATGMAGINWISSRLKIVYEDRVVPEVLLSQLQDDLLRTRLNIVFLGSGMVEGDVAKNLMDEVVRRDDHAAQLWRGYLDRPHSPQEQAK